MSICFAYGCNHNSYRETCSFFRFPKEKKLQLDGLKCVGDKIENQEPVPDYVAAILRMEEWIMALQYLKEIKINIFIFTSLKKNQRLDEIYLLQPQDLLFQKKALKLP